ncbi:MAG: isochorismatase family protein [Bacteroidales bacterium]|nr:isochorismatase family protein [Bacteroidales bacterium]
MNSADNNKALVVVDMLYDFIDGSLACGNAINAVAMMVQYINSHQNLKVYYVIDHHPENHCSFEKNGGIWPVHCVAGTRGGAVHEAFYNLENEAQRPSESNCFYKGTDPAVEQYSGFEARNAAGLSLNDVLPEDVYVCGIATEFCVLNTCKDLINAEHDVELIVDGLAFVDYNGHRNALGELEASGAKLV